ncbi:hydroxymethylglutaryl-CoA lyase, mitochondrial-like isoform X2 [Salvia splendens]|uniref:hydroxymethylglutaryl-CoA lyase, mitochondrial-like isoform X2 n=1 Tax=Salvia splendens TaxID=180675 RepID=UPI001C2538AD|nr:hydroxymethylglutaryl-CoA lyase, mitochondrial-like isoform X2 [Salvia splendens]
MKCIKGKRLCWLVIHQACFLCLIVVGGSIRLQLAFAKDVMSAIEGFGNYRYAVLTPNLKAAMAAGEKEVAVFAAVSESFSRSNLKCSI